MAKFRIVGGKPLKGRVKIAGNKNSALKLMAASILSDSPTTLSHVPKIRDIQVMGEILQDLGCNVDGLGTDNFRIDPRTISSWQINPELMRRIRASVVLAAPILVRYGKVRLPRPGGDSIGERLIDTHLSMLRGFGAKIKPGRTSWIIETKRLKPAEIFLEEASVTATEMALMIASTLKGETIIEGAASEPHVVDLVEYLRGAGAEIQGAGTNLIRIKGTENLKPKKHIVRPDHIEVGTFAIASAITGGKVRLDGVVASDLKIIIAYLSHMGVRYEFQGSSKLEILPSQLRAQKKRFHTRPWPGFPTDLMSPFIVLATQTEGVTLCHDWMYEWRIFFVDHLIKMGADITIADPHRVIVRGPTKLTGDIIHSADIRAGGALVLAALAADGESVIEHAEMIDRGYEDFDKRLASLGADIQRI